MQATTLKSEIAPYITEIIAELKNAGFQAMIVGGAVRDILLKRRPKDYDISTSATPEEVKRVFRKRHAVIIGRRFRLVHLYHGDEILEISTFRRKPVHTIPENGRPKKAADAPENMIFQDNEFGTPEEDAWRRDFTVNALFYDPVEDQVFDHTGMGLADLEAGIVRAIGEPEVRFEEDPVRILRAIKLIGQYGFHFDPETEQAVRKCMPLIRLASDSRMTLELEKILKSPYGDQVIRAFHEYGFLGDFLPALENHWNSADAEMIRKLWGIRNERIRAGVYRESISLAMSILVLPFAERFFRSAAERKLSRKEIALELESAIDFCLKPRTPTNRAVAAAVRTLMLQPELETYTPEKAAELLRLPGYAHARELAAIRHLFHGGDSRFEELWPQPRSFSGKRSRGRRFPRHSVLKEAKAENA